MVRPSNTRRNALTDTTQPHPEPSEEASSLPVVALRYRWTAQPGEAADASPWAATVGMVIWPRACDVEELTPLAEAQSQLNAMRVERDAARVLAASHSNECEKWAAMHQRSKAEISDLKTDYESRLKKLCAHGMGLCDQIDALKAALKAAQKEEE
jgi:hypothetical protein